MRNLHKDPDLVAEKDVISALAHEVSREKWLQVAVGVKPSAIECEMKTTKKDFDRASSKV